MLRSAYQSRNLFSHHHHHHHRVPYLLPTTYYDAPVDSQQQQRRREKRQSRTHAPSFFFFGCCCCCYSLTCAYSTCNYFRSSLPPSLPPCFTTVRYLLVEQKRTTTITTHTRGRDLFDCSIHLFVVHLPHPPPS